MVGVLGPVLGGMYGCVAAFEDSLASECRRFLGIVSGG